jgi:protein TonB
MPAPPKPADPAPAAASAPKQANPVSRFEEAQVTERIMPAYPPLARQFRAYGLVQVEAEIDPRGAVKSVRSVKGHPALAAAAKDAVLKWKFKPAVLNGQPIASVVVIDMNFTDGSK